LRAIAVKHHSVLNPEDEQRMYPARTIADKKQRENQVVGL